MLEKIAILLVLLWVIGMMFEFTAGGLIHFLLVPAAIMLIAGLSINQKNESS